MHRKSAVISFFLALTFLLAGASVACADEYTVQAGDTLWSIATRHGVTVDEVRTWNNMTGDTVFVGQTLVIAANAAAPETPAVPEAVPENPEAVENPNGAGGVTEIMYYTVHSGDTLDSIAAYYNTTPVQIIMDNELFSSDVELGQILKLNVPAGTVEKTAEASNIGTYYVQQGDTLRQIAELCAMNITDLKNLNGLSEDTIFVGQPLKITGEVPNVSRGGVEREPAPEPEPVYSGDMGAHVVDYALQFKGTRYAYGGTSPSGFDCSGFVQYVFRNAAGISLPRVAASQAGAGYAVSMSNLMPGDIVYFANGGYVSHVGIYIGSGQFIHCSSPRTGGVIISSLSQAYYSARYAGARRVL